MTIYTITAWITTVTAFIVGLFTYMTNTKREVNKRWFFMSLSITLWSLFLGFMFSSRDASKSLIYSKILIAGAIFIPITFYHFVLALLEQQKNNRQRKLLLIGYLITATLLLASFTPLFLRGVSYEPLVKCFYPNAGKLFILFIIFYFGFSVYSYFLMHKESKLLIGFRRNQVKYVMFASMMGFLGGATTFPLWYRIQILPFGSLFVWFYAITISVAILRYRLMDIRVAITHAGIFAFVYSVVLGIPFLIVKAAKPYLVGALSERWWIVILAIGMILAGVGPFIYIRLKSRAEVVLLREERKKHQALARVSRDILRFNRLSALLRVIVHNLIRIMQVKLAAVYLVDEDKKVFSLKAAWEPPVRNPKIPSDLSFDSALIKILNNKKGGPLNIEEISFYSQNRKTDDVYDVMKAFASLKAQIIIPAIRSDKLVGFLVLGDKRSGRVYSQGDIEVLMVLANHATLAIENAIFNEQERERQAILFHSASLASLGTMASMMGHQVNNRFQAVNNLAGSAETLELMLESKDHFSDEEWKKLINQAITSLRKISDEATKGGEIVASIRRLGKLSSEEFKPITIREVLDVALGVLRYKIKFEEFEFIQQVPDTLPKIAGDATQLGEVFFNLIDNAYDAIKERSNKDSDPDYKLEGDGLASDSQSHKPKLSIRAYIKKNDKRVYVEVADTGMGIKDDFMSKLFVPFYTTKASSGKGTGLGLHVIKRIIEFHKGKIFVKSKYGEGTTFIIELPTAEIKEEEKVSV